ncbi:hypothetical protein C8J56DRAFT_890188 [Mycena floridula]|nr:hypothetical protein C8J56DRAFT_890188 [Mycena floridula]
MAREANNESKRDIFYASRILNSRICHPLQAFGDGYTVLKGLLGHGALVHQLFGDRVWELECGRDNSGWVLIEAMEEFMIPGDEERKGWNIHHDELVKVEEGSERKQEVMDDVHKTARIDGFMKQQQSAFNDAGINSDPGLPPSGFAELL